MSEGHQGARAPGPLVQAPDRRINELDQGLRLLEATSTATAGLRAASDPFRAVQAGAGRLDRESLAVGLVVHPLASLGWYKVQVGGGRGFLGCCQLSGGGLIPLGVRDLGGIPANSTVLVHQPRGLNYGVILGVLPPQLRDGRIVNPDWLVAGGQSGLRREALHQYPLKYLYKQGGVIDFSGQRPLDATALERGLISSTGIALLLDDYQAYLRVNEQCGLFLNYFDSHARLAGVQLDVASAVHEEEARDDEGEASWFRGEALYPWEALGLYAPDTAYTEVRDDKAVQYDAAFAKVDLAADALDVEPFYRWREYGGYLGQGRLRLLAAPPRREGVRRHGDAAAEPDVGLFRESIGVDGAYSLHSAKSVRIGRRVNLAVPRRRVLPEDPTGDDAAADAYKFSGKFGAGESHRLAPVRIEGAAKSMRKLAAVDDLAAFQENWQAVHPFHYHRGDYSLPAEAAVLAPRTQDALAFGELADSFLMSDPTPVTLTIDHRYSDVEFFARESFLHLTDDGGVALGCGWGAQLLFGGGSIRLEAPGDVQICPGRDLIALADQVVVRARQSVDVSATDHDVRIKAQRNVQVLAAEGGLLLESTAEGATQDYAGKVGEDVGGAGVVLRAPQSVVAALGGEVYLRTGGGDMAEGPIVLDAAKGAAAVQLYGSRVDAFCAADAVRFHLGPVGETSEVARTYEFGRDSCLIAADLDLGGRLTGFRHDDKTPGLVIDGSISCTGSIAAAGSVASGQGGMLGRAPDGYGDQLAQQTAAAVDRLAARNDAGAQAHAALVQAWYAAGKVGADAVVPALQFTFRDPVAGDQYHAADLQWTERRWEQLARLGGGSGGAAWDEKPVRFEGQDLFPWPGRRKWREDAAFLRLASTTMYDAAAGAARDRPDPYEAPELADWEAVTMQSAYRLVRQGGA